LQARLDELAALFAEGSINGRQLKRGTTELTDAIIKCDNQLAASTKGNPIAALIGTSHAKPLKERWHDLSPDIRGKIIDELLTVTVNRSPRGLRRFDPAYVDVKWRVA